VVVGAGSSVREADERTLLAASGSLATPAASAFAVREAFAVPDTSPSGELTHGLATFPLGAALPAIARGLVPSIVGSLALEVDRGVPFLLIPVFLAIGVFAYVGLNFEPTLTSLGVATAISIAAALALRTRPAAYYATATIALILAGMLLASLATWRASTKMLGGEISTLVTGRVVGIDRQSSGRVRLTIDVTSTERPTLRYAPERIRASARKVPDGLTIGSQVSGIVRLQPPSGPVSPNGYDFSFESYFDGIGASGFFLRGPELLAGAAAAPTGLLGKTEALRLSVADRVRARIGGPEGEIAAALLVGVRAGIPEAVNEALRRSGLYHVISISGLHMALVAATFMTTLRAFFALFPAFASRHPVKKYAALLAIAAIAGYLFISGGEVAAQRSFIMLAVMLAAVLFDRAALTMRNLAISAILVIAWSPHEVVGPSFQMSFAATAALVGCYALWSERRAERAGGAPPSGSVSSRALRHTGALIVGLAVTSVVAGLATAAFGAYHFQRVSPLSLASNLAAMPIVSLVVVPSGVLAAAAMPFGLEGLFLDIMGKGIAAMMAIAQWFSESSPVDAVGLVSRHSVILLTIALVIASVATTGLRLVSLPFALAGLVTLGNVRTPDALILEDASLVGVVTPDDALAINRERASGFVVENWRRTVTAKALHTAFKANDANAVGTGDEKRFACTTASCAIRAAGGHLVVWTQSAIEVQEACGAASLIVLTDPTVTPRCADPKILVVTARDLALRGSAAVYLSRDGETEGLLEYAISDTGRPWHHHRQFSRAARGLAPYRRTSDKPTAGSPTSAPAAAMRPPPADATGRSDAAAP